MARPARLARLGRRPDTRGRAKLLRRVTVPAGEQTAIRALIDVFRSAVAEPHDRGALDVLVTEIDVAGRRRVEPIPGELDAIEDEALLAAHVLGKRDAAAVGERLRLAVDLHRDRRVRRRLHAEHANGLEILSGVAGRLHTPRAQMIEDVRGREAEARREDGAALKLIGCDIGEPLAHILAANRRGASSRIGRRRDDNRKNGRNPPSQRPARHSHGIPLWSRNTVAGFYSLPLAGRREFR